MDLWIAGILLLATVLMLIIDGCRGIHRSRRRCGSRLVPEEWKHGFFAIEPPLCPGGEPRYAILDFQTTGLNVDDEGDRILQAAWMIVDAEYRMVRRGICLVAQESVGSLEARAVHGLSSAFVRRYGIPEPVMLSRLWKDIEDVPVWVAHNMAFDMGMLRSSVRRFAPELEETLESRETICTMIDFIRYEEGERYPALIDLTERLIGWHLSSIALPVPVAWRNVCLTRICLSRLLESNRYGGVPRNDCEQKQE